MEVRPSRSLLLGAVTNWAAFAATMLVAFFLAPYLIRNLGDARYGGARQSLPMARPFLHAEALELQHPVTDEPLSFRSPLPDDLAEVLGRLRVAPES